MVSAPIFYTDVQSWAARVIVLACLAVELLAIVHCATRRRDAFAAVGNASKGMWVAMTVGALLWTALFGLGSAGGSGGGYLFFATIGIAVAFVYLLDVRPAIRDALNGRGGW